MKHYYFAILLLPVLFTSCTHYYYAPTTANIPMLREKNEARINANWYITDEASGGELQLAYATGKRTAFMLNILSASSNGMLLSSMTYNPGSEPAGYGKYAELGYGFFDPVPTSKWIFETYAGIGTGSITNWYSTNEKSRVGISKIFVQPSLGWRTTYFEIAFSSRFAFANLKVKNNSHANQEVNYIKDHPSAFLVEPAMLIRFGLKHVKISLNYTHSGNLSNNWQQETTAVSAGLSIPFGIDK